MTKTTNFIGRIDALDLMRGWFLVVIAADHLLRFPSIFDPFTGRGLLWVTAAEGFFFISGMLVGIARGRDVHTKGIQAATKKVWSRAAKLYVASVVLSLLYTFVAYYLQSRGVTAIKGGLIHFGSAWDLLINTLTLGYNYGWADFLGYYAVFLALSPLALLLLRHRLWWVIVWISLTLWLVKDLVNLPFPSFYGIWQVYFFLGMVFGHHFGAIRTYFELLPQRAARLIRGGIVVLSAITVVASLILTFGTPFFLDHGRSLTGLLAALHLPPPAAFYDFFFNVKENRVFNELLQNNRTGILRLPLFLLWFAALFIVVRRYEDRITRYAGWLLLPLGKNSLYVYIIQSVLAFSVPLLFLPFNFAVNSLINVAAILICWVAVKRRFLFRIIPR